ncbi:MAG TPA: hypothetical protein PK926_08040 [Spirochaetota bacterium]|nr:hypothetical protein [Spirochaetota bacterium]HPI88541.1 hypothetical protein [Spirochaetota bacterium]HPR48021.1 hypothetical protein [Spirochaetota bacterium]
MKEKEVRVEGKDTHQLIMYVEKEDGSYDSIMTGSYLVKNYVDDFWEKKQRLEQEFLEKIKNGEVSPIALYMMLEELTEIELAGRVGISVRKVRKHLKPEYFETMTLKTLKRYAEVFDVPVINLLQAIVTKKSGLQISIEKTNNPLFCFLRVEGN